MANIAQFENVGMRYGEAPRTFSDVSFSMPAGSFSFRMVLGAALGRVL